MLPDPITYGEDSVKHFFAAGEEHCAAPCVAVHGGAYGSQISFTRDQDSAQQCRNAVTMMPSAESDHGIPVDVLADMYQAQMS